jgi:hypothetical protein
MRGRTPTPPSLPVPPAARRASPAASTLLGLLVLGLLGGPAGPVGAQDTAVPEPEADLGPVEAPPAAKASLEDVRRSVTEIDSLVLQGDTEAARAKLAAAERQLASIRQQHEGELPAGHVPMLVLEERLAALRQQLDESD